MNFDRKICGLGVAGGSASGKTTIINKVKEYFGNDIVVISHDSYYKVHDEMTFEERCKLNYDHPDSFESEPVIVKPSDRRISERPLILIPPIPMK